LTAASAYWPGMVGNDSGSGSTGTYGAIYNLMNYMAGTVQSVKQYYFVEDTKATDWSDPASSAGQIRDLKMNQWSTASSSRTTGK